jgi:hypothetical protein
VHTAFDFLAFVPVPRLPRRIRGLRPAYRADLAVYQRLGEQRHRVSSRLSERFPLLVQT